ncbi:hypothetical protein N7451_002201 [Penicillium sp. IBT 35674x]|nr:hypothetical protein N7451_002201 [Penicillium sp. IBT 35674x]
MLTEDTHRLIAQLKELHDRAPSNPALRNKLYDALVRATVAIGTPWTLCSAFHSLSVSPSPECFEFAMTRPELFTDFKRIAQAAKTIELPQPVFIDVGGGVGHQCASLVQRMPELSCRVRLQDLQPVVERAIPGTGVQVQAYDFGPGYPDERCRVLLEQQLPALGASSALLIDETMIPSVAASRHGVELDIAMMAGLAAIERTEGQWADLFRSAGLRVVETFCYDPQTGQSLMVIVPLTQ